MSERPDGGSAFPRVTKFYEKRHSGERNAYLHNTVESTPGMSLRDWFAGQALVGMGQWAPVDWKGNHPPRNVKNAKAEWAYQMADAMLAERRRSLTGEET